MKLPTIAPFDKLLTINGTPAERIIDLVHVLESMVAKALKSGSTDEQLIERNRLLVEEVHQIRQANIGHRRSIDRLKEIIEAAKSSGPSGEVVGYQVIGVDGAIFKMRRNRSEAEADAKGFPQAKLRPLRAGVPEDVEPTEDYLPPAIRE